VRPSSRTVPSRISTSLASVGITRPSAKVGRTMLPMPRILPDAETNFPLFTPVACGDAPSACLLLKIQPNEEICPDRVRDHDLQRQEVTGAAAPVGLDPGAVDVQAWCISRAGVFLPSPT
jgi:hypothetical protein